MISDQQMMQRVIIRYFQMIGRSSEIDTMLRIVEDFLKNSEKNKFTVIRGGYGIGKSLLVRVLLNKIVIENFFLQNI